ncbi:MAG TPA: hypothetical protein VF189_01855, partial [Patescibacteria group bacterium]
MPQDKFGDRSPYDYFKGLDIKPNPVKLDIQALLKDVVYKPIRTQHLDASQILAGSFPYEMTDKSPVLKDDPHKKLVFDLPGSPIHTGVQMYSIHTDLSNLNLGKKSPLELGINSDKTGIVIKSGDKSSLVELSEGKPVIVSTIAQDGTLAIAEDGITVENSSYKNSKQPDAKPRDVTNV